MKYIKKIGFKNFRVFDDSSMFEIAPITVLTGGNSSGKSTVIKGMKLMQQFWAQKDFGHNLNFSDDENNHQLGNFEMSLTKNSDTDNIVFSYEMKHIAFDDLRVELTFEKRDNELKDAVLTRALVNDKKGVGIYSIQIKGDDILSNYNYEYIINSIIPKIKSLIKEQASYEEKTGGDTPISVRFIMDPAEAKNRKSVKEICEDENIDYDRFLALSSMFLWQFGKDYPEPSIGNIKGLLDKWEKGNFLYDSEIISVFAEMQSGEFVLFEENLWSKILEVAPEAEDKFNILSFKNRVDELQIGSWVNDFLTSGDDSFATYYNKCVDEAVNEYSKFLYKKHMGVIDNVEHNRKFYNHMDFVFASNSNTFFDSYSERLFDKQPPLTDVEKRISNASFIIDDARKIHELIYDSKPKFPINSLLNLLENFFISVSYKNLEMDFETIYFVNSIRASSHRFYSFSSHESPFHRFIKEFLRKSYKEEENAFITKWLKEFEIADDYVIDVVEGAGSQIYLVQGGDKVNLVDMGYGVTQFLPIILKVAYCNNIGKKTIVIEEPETNLHPRFQSKLAELFVDAYKVFGISFILETHSEYLVRKLQYLTAKGDINTDQTVIHYIGNPDKDKRAEGEEQIITINIKPNGHLSRPFGTGFLDEADNLAMSLLDFALN